jgi:mannosyltransferase
MRLNNRGAWAITLALILLLAVLLRLWNINKESFWADEGWSMLLSKGPTLPDVVQAMANDQHPPLYFALLHYWIDLTGNSEVATRLLSTFWSLVGVALAYRIGAELFSPGAGAAAALMLALADNDTMLAQEARHYTQMATLAALSTLFYLRYFRHASRRSGIGWLLSSSALMYTHYLGVFILIVQLIHMAIFARPLRRLADMLFRWLAIGLSWLPWGFVFVEQSLVRYTRPRLFQSTMPNTPETFALVRGDLLGAHFGLTFGLLLLGLVYVCYRDGRVRLNWRPARPTLYLALWFAVPIVSIVAINTRYGILTPRNFLLITPAIAVLIGHGLMNLDRPARTFLLTVLVVVGLTTTDAYFIKPPWRQVALDIVNYWDRREPVLMDVWVDDLALRYHIGRDLHADPASLPLLSMPEWREQYREAFYAYLLQTLSDKDSLWLAYWGDPQATLIGWLAQQGFTRTGTQMETHLGTNQIFVYRYDRVPKQGIAHFGDLFELKRYQIEPENPQPGDVVRANLLWQALQHPTLGYSVSVFVLNSSGQLVAQHDAPPFEGRSPTDQWQSGDARFDSHRLALPPNLPPGQYQIGLKVYWYGDEKPLPVTHVSGRPADYFVLRQIEIPGRETP